MTSIDIHILQTVPPSNLNRDDTGSPKSAVYGGAPRARVSSQSWKRATRRSFGDRLDRSDLGVRTKRVIEVVAEEIRRVAPDRSDDANELAEMVLRAAGIELTTPKVKKGEEAPPAESKYLLFLARNQINRLAALAVESAGSVDKKAAKAAADQANSIDVALFGRMVADDAELNVDAAAQVAHALSVHKVDNEFDYFTAVDDRKADAEETGAGMIGTVEFNSSTLYRYATVNLEGLRWNLGDDLATRKAVVEFVRAFSTSMPTGKQNTFANRTLPDAVVVQIREQQSINLVGAFEDPVVARHDRTRLGVAAERLADHAQAIDNAYGTGPSAAYVLTTSTALDPLEALGDAVNFDELLSRLDEAVAARLASS